MSYPILNPANPVAARAGQCALAVMAKAPRPGKVKTRLSPPLTLDQSAAINICFLRDTAENIAALATSGKAAGIISYTPIGDEALFDHLLPADFGGPILTALFPILWFVAKVLAFLLLFIWVRGTLPRFRYDQLMSFGWKFLLPVAMANIIITSLVYALHS